MYRKKTNRISEKNTDWEEYRRIMLRREATIDSMDYGEADIERKYVMITQNMIEAVKMATNGKRRIKQEE